MQFVTMDTHNSKTAGISLQLKNIYEHYAQAHLSTVINESFIICAITMYDYFMSPKGVNK